ncbi:voltage-gated potassium channel [Aureococcus anophagefferens]|nr:voltage-gated potassium channel [Aureococcus anophagefferens]
MAEATDVEEDNPRKLRTPNSRSSVDLSLSPDDQIFDQFFLHEKGDRETVWLCSLAFNFLWSEAFIHHAFGIKRGLEKTDAVSWQVRQFRALVKHVGTILYAVLIRQLVICPCLYQPLIDAACDESADLDADELRTRADALVEWKWRGDRTALLLLLVHFFFVFAAVAFVAFNSHEHVTAERYGEEHVRVLYHVLYSELVNFVSWFIRFTPLFLLLFPIHRAQWYQGGRSGLPLLRRSCRGVVVDARSPCVVPETTALRSARLPSRLSSILSFSGGDMATLRHA